MTEGTATHAASDWARLEELFHASRELDSTARAVLLSDQCGANTALRASVERLLRHHDREAHGASSLGQRVVEASLARVFGSDRSEVDVASLAQQLGSRFELRGELGRGGSSVVFDAYDGHQERPVAVKVLLPERYGCSRARFAREIELVAGLSHPHVLPIWESGQVGAFVYYLTARADTSLDQRIARRGRFPVTEAVDLAHDIASALAHAHHERIVHRDVKPANILLRGERPLLADFGVARAVSVTDDSALTTAGMILGTPAYMSPEQARGERDIDGRSDIYSLGCVLYELLTGAPPFADVTARRTLSRRLAEDPPPLRRVCPDASPALEAVVGRMLAREPGQRVATAAELAEVLGALDAQEAALELTSACRTVLVLPFTQRNGPGDEAYLADGITDELIAILSRVDGLQVVARNSAFRLRGTTESVQALGQRLQVEVVLEGSVQRAGNRLRVWANLVSTSDGRDLLSERFDQEVENILDAQDEVARAVARALRVHLQPARDLRPDARAYDYYLRAREQVFRFTGDALSRAVDYLQQAIACVGPSNISLQAGLGYAYWQYVNAGLDPDPKYLAMAQQCAERILSLDSDSPHGHRLAGLVAIHRGQGDRAIARLERALELLPNDPDCLFWLTLMQGFRGNLPTAKWAAERAVAIDPLIALHHMLPGFVALMSGRYLQAPESFRVAREMEPANPVLQLGYGQALAMAGERDRAVGILLALSSSHASSMFGSLAGFLGFALQERATEAEALMAGSLGEAAETDLQWCWTIAQGYALLDQVEPSLTWLGRAVASGLTNAVLLSSDPLLAPLHAEEGFRLLVASLDR